MKGKTMKPKKKKVQKTQTAVGWMDGDDKKAIIFHDGSVDLFLAKRKKDVNVAPPIKVTITATWEVDEP